MMWTGWSEVRTKPISARSQNGGRPGLFHWRLASRRSRSHQGPRVRKRGSGRDPARERGAFTQPVWLSRRILGIQGGNDGSPGRECHIEPWISAIPSGPFRVEVGKAGTMRHVLGKGGDRVMELQV